VRLSIVIVTHNRREALRHTLSRVLPNPDLPHGQMELIVVDNASTDGTAAWLAESHPSIRVLRRPRNEGVSARNHAFAEARGAYVLLIDDDSHPVDDAVARSLAYMDEHPRVAAVGGRVELLDGRCEASALPAVTINCAVVLRKAALDEVGGFPREFFRQAEEYDLCLRLWQAGWRVERFEDLVYRHNKAPGNRNTAWVHRLDIRNNLILLERYLPAALRSEYRADWTQRYRALARHAGRRWSAWLGQAQGRAWFVREAIAGRSILGEEAIEAVFDLQRQRKAVSQWAPRHGVRRVAIADFSKNLYATWRACRDAGLDVVCIADGHPAYASSGYRGVPIVSDDAAARLEVDGVVLSNVNPAQIERRYAELLLRWEDRPVLRLWQPRLLGQAIRRPSQSNPSTRSNVA
jgi:GT2 family glycosyltransferase